MKELKRQHATGYERFRREVGIPRHHINEIHWEKVSWRDKKGQFTRAYVRYCAKCKWPLYPVMRIVERD